MIKQEQIKTVEQLGAMTPKRLLAYYKAVRLRKDKYKGAHTCECCGVPDWDESLKKPKLKNKVEYDNRVEYLKVVKGVLESKGHVKR